MLRIAVAGTLAHHIGDFSSARTKTEVEWTELPSSDVDLAKLDLIVRLTSDVPAASELAAIRKQNSIVIPIISVWNEVPSAADLDAALQRSLSQIYGFVVGYSADMHVACRWIRAVSHQASAALDLRTLVTGETGTGKELVAMAIHKLAGNTKQFVAVNCSAIPSSLLEAELFGYEEGAFTGATKRRQGWFRAAAGGTLFLDEIGDLPLDLQSKLLRTLENRSYSPLGTEKKFALNARVVSATNKQLDEAIVRQEFRPDLYFRLAQINVFLPPLRERKEDISLLIEYFLRDFFLQDPIVLTQDEIVILSEQQWPGNIRELRSALERLALLWSTGNRPALREWAPLSTAPAGPSRSGTLAELRDQFDRRVLEDILKRCGGDTTRAAEELGITRRSIYNLINRLGIELHKLK